MHLVCVRSSLLRNTCGLGQSSTISSLAFRGLHMLQLRRSWLRSLSRGLEISWRDGGALIGAFLAIQGCTVILWPSVCACSQDWLHPVCRQLCSTHCGMPGVPIGDTRNVICHPIDVCFAVVAGLRILLSTIVDAPPFSELPGTRLDLIIRTRVLWICGLSTVLG